ncbi:SSI family serine proteinase inhibitor [Amycolatopsis sp. SID8362]|uniref:SSI family serine proteinase inhibitor n=1 Tax=Amycolatopsis sp. SID8362 TaxID=2690346 RepID=UPI0013695837|nr:SSI family serine proteinase inhibitor [Amycolatopsis sp. SID8362]NBH03502.1 hypothetical protein [Amycolatopsis sp. SID8362]NED40202.1 hypothetical protein [Amycolatopsis sp. SID8362]
MLALAATAGISLVVPAAAQAAPAGTVGASLMLTKTYEYGPVPGRTVSETLTCSPTGGTHPNAARACEELARVEADFDSLGSKEGADQCKGPYNEYLPVEVTAHGIWGHEPVDYRASFPNSCWLSATTGSIFQF